ncbi:heparinase II/III domain-containing protein [Pseudoduganella armeniaca]|uniref:Heparinase II/III-like C-terminal domain-containing protein n=1 Tax=Pseudoduganella armeniaca TaxID=2072590 RepID=A0A2R4C9G6_9BURK|nr:heparinase II/III family protein [Pseudoduganella armeniaca]AVR96225.1 hypothetical protein C9I28_11275 [Pseudoduganella armeniaca]
MSPLLGRLGVAVAVSGIFAGSAQALPRELNPDHPRLFTSIDDLRRLISEVPLLNSALPNDVNAPAPVVFPSKKGRLSFKLKPSKLTREDGAEAVIFGDINNPETGIFLRYRPSQDVDALLQFAIKVKDSTSLVAADTLAVPADVETTFDLTWDVATGKAVFKIGAREFTRTLPAGFDLSKQPFLFGGRRGDAMSEFHLYGELGNEIQTPATGSPNLEMGAAWRGLLAAASNHGNGFSTCLKPTNANDAPSPCKQHTGSRAEITELAKTIAFAYRLTGKDEYLQAARNHLKLFYMINGGQFTVKNAAGENVPSNPGTGGEWSMSSRVGAMGVYYDWLFNVLDPAEKTALREAIKQTVQFDNAGKDDLRYSVCGPDELLSASFSCKSDWTAQYGPNYIARNYISGHTQAAQFGTLLGLLAIRDEMTEVDPMIDTIHQHFRDGYLPARAAISYKDHSAADAWLKTASWGGHQTLFSYNGTSAGELPERVLVWQRAFKKDKDGNEIFQAPWLPYLMSPYIYGFRGDGTFPASGDNFTDFKLGESDIALMALSAARNGDKVAYGFYREQILSRRRMSHDRSLWERLILPTAATQQTESPAGLPLSAHYSVGGNVLMRDSWDYPNAALLDFKSSSFISENHHHMDQNSFSLFYKAPLLVDSGQYDSYESVHWKNYSTRTVAHNSIVVYDSKEKFVYPYAKTEFRSNDGGQWFDGRDPYPTYTEINGSHKLDGVTAYEEGGSYAYVQGDATKAYKRGTATESPKLNPDAGFLRSLVYLRPAGRQNTTSAKAIVVVFDKVRTGGTEALAATSLLHTVHKPVAKSEPSGSAGRYTYAFPSDESTFTVRNGGGMATVQALLPKGGKVTLVGGLNYGGNSCKQVGLTDKVLTVKGSSGDCRYLAPGTIGNVTDWYNYTPEGADGIGPDNGVWRLEITPTPTPAAGAAQYFLNVIRVADSSAGETGQATVPTDETATLIDTGPETVAVQVGTDRRIVFNGGTRIDMWPVWKHGAFQGTTQVFGLIPNQWYAFVDHNGMKALKPYVGQDYKSSPAGVITIR